MQRIYADYAATSPLIEPARVAMAPWLESGFGNPSSLYKEGRAAKDAIDLARETISRQLGCLFAEVLFTGSGTEAANLAILGVAAEHRRLEGAKRRVLLGAAEHHCVLHTCNLLRILGFEVDLVPVDGMATIDLRALDAMMHDDVLLVSCMFANNEFGTIQPVKVVADLVHRYDALYHCDAVQSFGVWPWKVAEVDADLMTLSAHKLGGPKGVGAIYVRAGVKLQPLVVGGGQEREIRAGTENVAGIVGFAAAAEYRAQSQNPEARHPVAAAFESAIGDQAILTVPLESAIVLPGHVHIRFPGVPAETLLIRLDREGVSASAGAACSSGSIDPSHVMLAAGYSEVAAREGVRFSFGFDQPEELGRECADRVLRAVTAIRATQE